MSAFHYYAVKDAESNTLARFAMTIDYINQPEPTIKVDYDKRNAEIVPIDESHSCINDRARLEKAYSWLRWKIKSSLDRDGSIDEHYRHTA
jgi:hypothetical protein